MSSKSVIDLGNYQIIESLGQGSYGESYLIEEKKTKKKYVAKVSSQECIEKNKQTAFSNIISTLSTLKHPVITKIYGYNLQNFSGEKYPTIVTEYMGNKTLRQMLEDELLSKSTVKWNSTKKYICILGIAFGIQYLHLKGIIHRGLNLSNIYLDENLHPHLSDFSTYKLINSISSNYKDEGVCTSLYTAPEIFFKNTYNNKVDVYSFAYIFYDIINGKPTKIEQENLSDFMKIIKEGKRPSLSMIPIQSVKDFLEKCWSNDPNKRPSFDQIISTIGNRDFYSLFSIGNKKEVFDYVNSLPDGTKGKKFILSQLEEDIEMDKKQLDKINKRKNPIKLFVILVLVLFIYSLLNKFFQKYA